jgi:hypothetical protein
MGILKNPRHESFARAYLELGTARAAYMAAGYKACKPHVATKSSSVDTCASRLLKRPEIAQRLSQLVKERIREEKSEARSLGKMVTHLGRAFKRIKLGEA